MINCISKLIVKLNLIVSVAANTFMSCLIEFNLKRLLCRKLLKLKLLRLKIFGFFLKLQDFVLKFYYFYADLRFAFLLLFLKILNCLLILSRHNSNLLPQGILLDLLHLEFLPQILIFNFNLITALLFIFHDFSESLEHPLF